MDAKVIRLPLLLCLSGLFIYAGILKALDPGAFSVEIDRYHLLPWEASVLLALYLPWMEITCGAALLFGKIRKAGLWLMVGMLLVFLVALASAWARGLDIHCGCFGSADAGSTIRGAMVRDIGILTATLWLFLSERKPV